MTSARISSSCRQPRAHAAAQLPRTPSDASRRYSALRDRPSASAASLTLPPWRRERALDQVALGLSSVISSRRGAPPSVRGAEQRSSALIVVGRAPGARARSTTCSSSRTLPGQACASSASIALGEKPATGFRSAPPAARKSAASSRDVFAALAQRRQADLDGVEAVEQVLAEAAVGHRACATSAFVAASTRTSTRRGRDSRRDGTRRSAARAAACACWLERHVRDLVEEQRAAVGELEAAGAIGLRVGERALHVAEQLALEHTVGEAARVDGDERLVRRARRGVDAARDHFFAGAVLAGDQHARVRAARRARRARITGCIARDSR